MRMVIPVPVMIPIVPVTPLPIFFLLVPVTIPKIAMMPVRLVLPAHVIAALAPIPTVIIMIIGIVDAIPRMRSASGDQRDSRKRSNHSQRTAPPPQFR